MLLSWLPPIESVHAERARYSRKLRDDLLGVFGTNTGVQPQDPGKGALSPESAPERSELIRLPGRTGSGPAVPERCLEPDRVVPVFDVFVHEQLHVLG